ncbi:MAG: type I DNA topoisomerase [Erysipelotrichaceae bacterium]|jgi:DNA topoisomerase-1|nr:type I DNA topoisomerase [Erysipelotrichaceae bacterium]
MKNLVIVESPSKSKTIEKYLGKDFKVTSSKGHICDLATKGKEGLGVDVENDFKPTYEVSADKKSVVSDLKKMVKDADFVYLATDPDREGEAISWHLARELGLKLDENNRIVFNEITKNAVLKALEEPRTIDMALVRSQETRRILDRIIGFKLSKLLQKKIGSKSAGRVQSIALRMICDREKEIEAFVPEEYWTITADLGKKMLAALSRYQGKKIEIKNEAEADAILKALSEEFLLQDISEKSKKRAAYLPFITSTLQQEASTKLGFTSKKTMMVAQSLYEGVELANGAQGLITYMRTDSTRLSNEFVAAAYDKIGKEFGKEYKGFYRVKNDGTSQDAHEAIRPTSLANEPEAIRQYLSNDQYKLYRFIYYRALASLMKEAVFKSVTYSFDNNGYEFTVSGSKMEFDGFLKVYGDYDGSKDIILPKLEKGDILKAKKIEKEQHFTEGPSRYTEAKLIKALEEEGVGRPSTYATIIDTIEKRNYVEYKKASDSGKTKYFFPTRQGILTDEKLREYFRQVINIKYTAEMESELDEIAEDKLDSTASLRAFYDRFQPLVDSAYEKMEKVQPEKTGETCPECGGDVVIRNGRFGKFKSCINYPTCKWHESLVKKEEPEEIGRTCPECGMPLLKRKSRYGNYFIGCSNYPKCKYIESIDSEQPKRFYRRKKK